MGGLISRKKTVDAYSVEIDYSDKIEVGKTTEMLFSSSSCSNLSRDNSTIRNPTLLHDDNFDDSSSPSKNKKKEKKVPHQNSAGLEKIKSGARLIALSRGRLGIKAPWVLKNGMFSKNVTYDDFEIYNLIGTGMMGTVRLVKLKQTEVYVAIKSISKDFVKKHHDERHIAYEKEILLKMHSNFCMRLFGTFQDDRELHFIMEYFPGGELFRHLSLQSEDAFPAEVSRFYVLEVFSALDHVHELGYAYRDLKPENIMLDEYGHCKLVDFGFATVPDAQGLCRTTVGTPAYLSPELLNGKKTNGYTRAVDWWALGCLIYELMTGMPPFCKSKHDSKFEIYLRVLKGNITYSRKFSTETRKLISQLCHFDVNKRLVDRTAIKAFPYFAVDWAAVEQMRLIPPFVPHMHGHGDHHYFDKYAEQKTSTPEGSSPVKSVRRSQSSSSIASFEGF
eukprot:gene12602-26528_t